MGTVLYIKSSPRGEPSYSVATAEAFVAADKQAHPGDQVVNRDLFHTELPVVDGL